MTEYNMPEMVLLGNDLGISVNLEGPYPTHPDFGVTDHYTVTFRFTKKGITIDFWDVNVEEGAAPAGSWDRTYDELWEDVVCHESLPVCRV